MSTLCISQFRYSAQIRPSSVVTKDYTFKRPGWAGRFDQEGQYRDYQRTQYEVYDYPGRFKGAHGQNFARWQMDGWRNNAETARGMSRSPEIWPGRRIVLTGHPQANLNREWQVVASELHGEQPQAVPGTAGSGDGAGEPFCGDPGRQNMATTAVAETAGRRPAERCRDRTGRRGNLLRRTWSRAGEVQLGPL